MNRFVDRATIEVESGGGGNGCVSFRRERSMPKGGPDGGDGGSGGDVILHVDPGKRTLLDFHYQRHFRAGRGMHGQGSNHNGKDGADTVIAIPPGTTVVDVESGREVADLLEEGDRYVAVRGGRGGKGNSQFATATNRAPRTAEPGGASRKRKLVLELKLLADVGLVGLPNAGKSTFLARVTAARPKIANYPFTTLSPNLGLVRVGDAGSFLLADLPGLIEGASEGKGLGFDFLRHIERCRVLLFLIDATDPDPEEDLRVLRAELEAYDATLLERRIIYAWNKLDAVPDDWESPDLPGAHRISAVSGEGVQGLIHQLHDLIREVEEDGE